MGHAKPTRDRLLLDLVRERRAGVIAYRLAGSVLKVGELASKVGQPTLKLLQVLGLSLDSLVD